MAKYICSNNCTINWANINFARYYMKFWYIFAKKRTWIAYIYIYIHQLGRNIQIYTASRLLLWFLLEWLWGHKQNMPHIRFGIGRWFIGLPQLWHEMFVEFSNWYAGPQQWPHNPGPVIATGPEKKAITGPKRIVSLGEIATINAKMWLCFNSAAFVCDSHSHQGHIYTPYAI